MCIVIATSIWAFEQNKYSILEFIDLHEWTEYSTPRCKRFYSKAGRLSIRWDLIQVGCWNFKVDEKKKLVPQVLTLSDSKNEFVQKVAASIRSQFRHIHNSFSFKCAHIWAFAIGCVGMRAFVCQIRVFHVYIDMVNS